MSSGGSAIVTGAYGAIGMAICEGLIRHGFEITMAGRDRIRLEQAALLLKKKTGSDSIFVYSLDLGIRDQVKAFAEHYNKPVSVLLNNAATAPKSRSVTTDGIEVQFAVNVLGYFWMMYYFHQHVKAGIRPRIVNVASYWAGGLDFNDLEFKSRSYDPDLAYRQSKQANRMLSGAFSALFAPDKIMVNACHPGDVNSKLSNSLGFGGHETPAEGAATPLYVACSGEVGGITGSYFESKRIVHCPFMDDKQGVQRLYKICMEYTGLKENI